MAIRPRWRTLAYSVGCLAAVAAATVYVRVLMRVDPFLGLRDSHDTSNPIDIQFKDVKLKHWHAGKLVAEGQIGRVDIRRDRQVYDFYGITDGVYHTANSAFHFEGAHALWFPTSQRLEADRGDHVWNDKLDLIAPSFQYNSTASLLTINGPATGKLGGGRVEATNIEYHPATGAYKTGPISWAGPLTYDEQAGSLKSQAPASPPTKKQEDNESRIWHVAADDTEWAGGSHPYHYLKVRGTDDDSIITAPEATWDKSKDIITCTKGPIRYWSAKVNLVCDHLVVYRKERRAVATGNVVAYIKPEDKQQLDDKMEVPPFKPSVPDDISKSRPPAPMNSDPAGSQADDDVRSSDTIKKYPATVRCDKVVYFYKKGSRHADITGSPEAQQELPEGRWRMAWSHHAEYDGEKDLLYLYSADKERHDVRMKNSIGDDFVMATAQLSTKDGDDSFSASHMSGDAVSTDEEANEAASKAAKDKKSGAPPPNGKPGSGGLSGPIGRQT